MKMVFGSRFQDFYFNLHFNHSSSYSNTLHSYGKFVWGENFHNIPACQLDQNKISFENFIKFTWNGIVKHTNKTITPKNATCPITNF